MTAGIAAFTNHLPVRVRFGEEVSREIGELIGELAATRVLVVTDAGLQDGSAAVATCIQALSDSGLDVRRHLRPVGEPTPEMVDAVSQAIADARAEAIVAIGGGSSIDAAKAGRLCAQLGCRFRELGARQRSYPTPEIGLIAVPTTAGTGSEVSGGAVITDHAAGTKAGLAHPHLRAQYAVVDPTLTLTLPPSVTAHTGVDALAQAIAAVVARSRTPIGDAIALEAVRLAGRSLLRAYRDGTDAAARSEMACASLMAGLAMNISDCGAEHSLAQAIGARCGAPHGLTIGLVLAETLERERHHVPHQLERVADALGAPPDGEGDGMRAVSAIRLLLRDLDFPLLSSLGVSGRDVDALTELALDDFFITQSPEPWSAIEVRAAFAAALALRDRA